MVVSGRRLLLGVELLLVVVLLLLVLQLLLLLVLQLLLPLLLLQLLLLPLLLRVACDLGVKPLHPSFECRGYLPRQRQLIQYGCAFIHRGAFSGELECEEFSRSLARSLAHNRYFEKSHGTVIFAIYLEVSRVGAARSLPPRDNRTSFAFLKFVRKPLEGGGTCSSLRRGGGSCSSLAELEDVAVEGGADFAQTLVLQLQDGGELHGCTMIIRCARVLVHPPAAGQQAHSASGG